LKENIGLSIFLLAGCAIIGMLLASRPPHRDQTTCTPVPMPTGEQYYPAEFTLPPPTSVIVGQRVRIEFSGGMLVAATGQQCGDEFDILLPNQSTAEATIREVQVRLGDQVIHTQSCGYHCTLEFYIPSYFPAGTREWDFSGIWSIAAYLVFVQPLQLT
jgi:hypothetical protein